MTEVKKENMKNSVEAKEEEIGQEVVLEGKDDKTKKSKKSETAPVKSKMTKAKTVQRAKELLRQHKELLVIEKEALPASEINKCREIADSAILCIKKAVFRKFFEFAKGVEFDYARNFLLCFCDDTEEFKKFSYRVYGEAGEESCERIVLEKQELKNRALIALLKSEKLVDEFELKEDLVVAEEGKPIEGEFKAKLLKEMKKKVTERRLNVLLACDTKDVRVKEE
ncbi:hypothetical protein ECANGB1_2093 [Enterospora canceri]|uniref:Uncharacterized protein n=1 Tax=Enterospora canceri TaxID=1081671 RepID=A0A1Y1S8T4_9MICR|nr:hypothetical protein ECANGB1_2093 [Enterospora canceri]